MLFETATHERNFFAFNFRVSLCTACSGKLSGSISIENRTFQIDGLSVHKQFETELTFYVDWNNHTYSFFIGTIKEDELHLSWLYVKDKGAPYNGLTLKGSSILLSEDKLKRERPLPEFDLNEAYFCS